MFVLLCISWTCSYSFSYTTNTCMFLIFFSYILCSAMELHVGNSFVSKARTVLHSAAVKAERVLNDFKSDLGLLLSFIFQLPFWILRLSYVLHCVEMEFIFFIFFFVNMRFCTWIYEVANQSHKLNKVDQNISSVNIHQNP